MKPYQCLPTLYMHLPFFHSALLHHGHLPKAALSLHFLLILVSFGTTSEAALPSAGAKNADRDHEHLNAHPSWTRVGAIRREPGVSSQAPSTAVAAHDIADMAMSVNSRGGAEMQVASEAAASKVDLGNGNSSVVALVGSDGRECLGKDCSSVQVDGAWPGHWVPPPHDHNPHTLQYRHPGHPCQVPLSYVRHGCSSDELIVKNQRHEAFPKFCSAGDWLRHGEKCTTCCMRGFAPSISLLTCMNGKWSPPTYNCQQGCRPQVGNLTVCSAPKHVLRAGENCFQACNANPNTARVLTCAADGLLRGTMSPDCQQFKCMVPRQTTGLLQRGVFSCAGGDGILNAAAPMRPRGQCALRCHANFVPLSSTLHCHDDGKLYPTPQLSSFRPPVSGNSAGGTRQDMLKQRSQAGCTKSVSLQDETDDVEDGKDLSVRLVWPEAWKNKAKDKATRLAKKMKNKTSELKHKVKKKVKKALHKAKLARSPTARRRTKVLCGLTRRRHKVRARLPTVSRKQVERPPMHYCLAPCRPIRGLGLLGCGERKGLFLHGEVCTPHCQRGYEATSSSARSLRCNDGVWTSATRAIAAQQDVRIRARLGVRCIRKLPGAGVPPWRRRRHAMPWDTSGSYPGHASNKAWPTQHAPSGPFASQPVTYTSAESIG
mmetsp:Transcript_60092/g.143193  ORF Transcript_60092/g.143193 Transcript_60092/m.143193 type:complete len:657 (-) Transcript_60092:39-2009(-)